MALDRRTLLTGFLASGLAVPRVLRAAPPEPSEDVKPFKLVIELFGAGKTPLATAEMIAVDRLIFQFITEIPSEVLVIDAYTATVTLLDFRRKIQTNLSALRLQAEFDERKRELERGIRKGLESSSRNDQVLAKITSGLISPKFTEDFDQEAGRLTLKSDRVEVEALGVQEPDKKRLAAVTNGIAAVTRLTSLRSPDNLTPFARLKTLADITVARGLRPVEMNFLFRLPGAPQRLRWTYRLIDDVPERDFEAVSRVSKFRGEARTVRYERYDVHEP